jgi:NADH-dependent peroxiredoxin subunit F
MIYDMIILGAGPAGMTAAIYAARRKINFLMLGLDVGGQMSWSSDVENYPGIHFISGIELVKKFQEHIKDYNIKISQEEALDIKRDKKILIVKTKKRDYKTKTIIIATGKRPRKLNVPGEAEFLGKGVSYCATCDSVLQKNKTVAVIGGGNSALDAAMFLSKYAKKVYIMDVNPQLGGEAILKEKVLKNKKITPINLVKITSIFGNSKVTGLKYMRENIEQTLKLDSVFIEIGLVSSSDFTKIVKKNKWGEIMIFRSTKTNDENMTNIPGIFAAGDVTDVPAKQIVIAAGEGAKAAIAAFDYLNKFKER